MRKVFAVVAVLFAISLVVQLYLAGIGVFSAESDDLFAIHAVNGQIVLRLLALLTLIAAAFARAGKGTIWLSAVALFLIIFQTVLFILAGVFFGVSPDSHEAPPIGATILLALHPVIGVAALAIGGTIAGRAVRLGFPRARAATEPERAKV
ncbi:MAG: hypothetical protein QOF36_2134 [Microbacteriaceae bacterium]|jgi:hypothetical protein|nr:hypothetical protein [Microbacteriaceae bacterium]